MQLQLADLLSELRRRSKAVVDDDGLQGAMAQYTFLLKVSYVLNAIIWIACFVVCSLGGIFFDTFYDILFFTLLVFAKNGLGLVFGGVVICVSSQARCNARCATVCNVCNGV